MKLLLIFVIALATSTMSTDIQQIVQGNANFGLKFFKKAAGEDGNVCISPFSAHAVLSMAYQGAAGSTAEQFKTVLGLPDQETTAEQYHELMTQLIKQDNVILDIANKMYLMNNFTLNPNFKEVVYKKFLAEAQELDFGKSVEAANTINNWVENKTHERIKDLIKADMLNSMTRLVLVNALYFKGAWDKKFNKDLTKKDSFYLNNGEEIKVDMMHQTGKFMFVDDDVLNAKILEMPYKGHGMSMIIILPNVKGQIKELEEKLENVDLTKITHKLTKWEIDVSLPKFKIETEISMNQLLKDLGMGEMFSDKADFSNIAQDKTPLKVSDCIQKVFMEVNEEGAEAAAATGMVMVAMSMPLPVQRTNFKADHPFLVALITRDWNHSSVLFMGRIARP